MNGNLVEIGSKMKNDFIFNITKGKKKNIITFFSVQNDPIVSTQRKTQIKSYRIIHLLVYKNKS